MELNLAHLAPRFYGLWIALAGDRETVLGSGKTAEEAVKQAQMKAKRHDQLIVARVPRPEIPNDDLLAAIREGEAEEKAGKLTYYATADAFLTSLN